MPDAIPFYTNITYVSNSSGNVANAQAVSTLAAVTGKTNYLTSLTISFGGATGAAIFQVPVTGLLGGTWTFIIGVPAGAALAGVPIVFTPITPIPASAVNTAITCTVPALGAGNVASVTNISGFWV